MNDRIESLLRRKAAEQLDPAERAEVLEEMSLSEYELLHRARMALQSLDADAAPPPQLREALLTQGRKSGHFTPHTVASWQRRIPVWQAVAAAMIVAVAVSVWRGAVRQPVQEILVEKIVIQRDTVFQKDTLWMTRTEVRYRERAAAAPSPVAAIEINKPENRVGEQNASTPGTSMADMPAMLEFLGETGEDIYKN